MTTNSGPPAAPPPTGVHAVTTLMDASTSHREAWAEELLDPATNSLFHAIEMLEASSLKPATGVLTTGRPTARYS